MLTARAVAGPARCRLSLLSIAMSVVCFTSRCCRPDCLDSSFCKSSQIPVAEVVDSKLCVQVCVLSEGRSLYFGPPDEVVPWFSSLGYPLPKAFDGTVPDFTMDLVRDCTAHKRSYCAAHHLVLHTAALKATSLQRSS